MSTVKSAVRKSKTRGKQTGYFYQMRCVIV